MISKYFEEGRECYKASVPISDNPYKGEPARSWEAGWDHEWFQTLRTLSDRDPRH